MPHSRGRLYFINGPADWLMIGGLSILMFAAMGLIQGGYADRAGWLMSVAAFSWLCNWPHFAATNYRLYHSKENIRQYPVTALIIPVAIMGLMVSSFASPQGIAPYFVKLFLIWSPYHYSGQSVGISLLYARRAGISLGGWERKSLAAFIFGTFILQTARGEVAGTDRAFFGVSYPTFGLPQYVATVSEFLMWAGGAAFLAYAVYWSVKNRRMMPPIILLPAATQFVWFVLGWRVPSYYNFVPFFHGLQYLMIAWAMQLKEKMDENEIAPSRRFVLSETLRWGLGIFVGGVILFKFLPEGVGAMGYEMSLAEPLVISAVQIHHFFVDGVIWKLKNPKVGSPLMVDIEQLAGSAGGKPA